MGRDELFVQNPHGIARIAPMVARLEDEKAVFLSNSATVRDCSAYMNPV